MRGTLHTPTHARGFRVGTRRLITIASLALLGACASAPKAPQSWVEPAIGRATRADGALVTPIATTVATFVAEEMPPATTTLAVAPLDGREADDALGRAIVAALRRGGFGVATPDAWSAQPAARTPNAGVIHLIRYRVSSLSDGILLRLDLDEATTAARLFRRDARGLYVAASPMSVRRPEGWVPRPSAPPVAQRVATVTPRRPTPARAGRTRTASGRASAARTVAARRTTRARVRPTRVAVVERGGRANTVTRAAATRAASTPVPTAPPIVVRVPAGQRRPTLTKASLVQRGGGQ